MLVIKNYLSDLHAPGHVRGEVVAREINRNCPNMLVDCKMDYVLSDFYKANMMIFQRASQADWLVKAREAKRRGIKIVYEIDDDLLNMPENFVEPWRFYLRPEIRRNIQAFLELSDAIISSTEPLMRSLRKRVPRANHFVLPNAIDAEYWGRAFAERQSEHRNKDAVTVGWLASGSHKLDAPIVAEVLVELMKKHKHLRLNFIGWIEHGDLPGILPYAERVKCDQWQSISILPWVMKNFDISIAPLIDNKFNRAKSDIKWLQAGALGIPTVASKLDPYNGIHHGDDGFVAKTQKEWFDLLDLLITSKGLRDQIGQAANKVVLDKRDIRSQFTTWAQAYEMIIGGNSHGITEAKNKHSRRSPAPLRKTVGRRKRAA